MNVLLINQSNGVSFNENPPLGCLYLAAEVRDRGYKVRVYDQGAKENGLRYPSKEYPDDFRPDIVGVSLYTFGLPQAFRFLRELKQDSPGMVTVVGGHHATALPERTMQDCSSIDYLVYGEGEETFLELLRVLEKGATPEALRKIQGLCFRTPDIVKTPPRPLIRDLDRLPFPANELIQQYSYPSENIRVGKKILNLTSSRGCPFHCTYCNKAVHGSTYRRRSPGNVLDEIQTMFETYGYDEVMFHDELFTADRKWLDAFLDEKESRGLSFPWRCLCRVGTVTFEDLVRMHTSGCYVTAFGLEAGNEGVRKDLNRRMTNEQILASFGDARKAGMICYAFNMINHRLDTLDTVRDTYQLMRQAHPEFSPVFICSPLPGSKIYEEVPENIRYDWDRFNSYRDFQAVPISISSLAESTLLTLAGQMEIFYYADPAYLFRNVLRPGIPFHIRTFLLRMWLRSNVRKEKHLAEDDWFVDGRTPGKAGAFLHSLVYQSIARSLQAIRGRGKSY